MDPGRVKRTDLMDTWKDSEEAQRQTKALLTDAGIPLEIRVLGACRRFARDTDKRELKHTSERGIPTYEGMAATARPVIYDPGSGDQPMREVDCLVHLIDEFIPNAPFGIQHVMEIPIACKHRKDVEVFGIRGPQEPGGRHEFPIVSHLAGSELVRKLGALDIGAAAEPVLATTLLKIEAGKTPRKIHGEELIYNAGASLYDFVRFSAEAIGSANSDPMVEELLERFDEYLRKHRYHWLSSLYSWTRENISDAECGEYAKNYGMVFLSLTSWIPVVCVSSAIHEVVLDDSGEITELRPSGAYTLGLRVSAWRTFAQWSLVRRTAEAPVVITNPEGLPAVLGSALSRFERQRRLLSDADVSLKTRALLEANLVQAAFDKYAPREANWYRSDLDTTELVQDW